MKRRLIWLVAALVVVVLGTMLWRNNDTRADNVADNVRRGADSAAIDPAAVARGAYVAVASDCVACHTAPGSADTMAGGYAIQTPFGALVASNITMDRGTGIGNWTERDFFRAVRHGQSPHGYLYSAMPYNAYVKLTDGDMHDLWAYMRTIRPVEHAVVSNQLPFPFNIRLMMVGWNFLFFDNSGFRPDPAQSPGWNRGRYLVQGPAHCAACHTAKNLLGGDTRAYLQGGKLGDWFAPEIAGNPHVGLGQWSVGDITRYLATGSNDKAVASGPMAEAIEHSTQHLTAVDLQAIATYLKTVPGSAAKAPPALAADDAAMQRGAHVYEVNCKACHNLQGQGVPGMVTGFADNPAIRAPGVGSLVTTVLKGGRAAITKANPTGAGMPSFAWKLDDDDVAAVLTYVRNSWGNAAAPVTADEVGAARRDTRAHAVLATP
jgi:mono/diheme cytochrome c family protein